MASKIKDAQISTDKRHTKDDEPRLPHEHDESFDSQTSGGRDDMKQAHEDIERGLVDTDRRGTPGVEEVQKDKARLPPAAGEVAKRSEDT